MIGEEPEDDDDGQQPSEDGDGDGVTVFEKAESEAAAMTRADQDREWLKTVWSLVETRFDDADRNPRVEFAYDQMRIAAFERMSRILRSDLPGDKG